MNLLNCKLLAAAFGVVAGMMTGGAQAVPPGDAEILETLNRYLASIPAIRGRIEVSGYDGTISTYMFQKGGRCGVPLDLHIRRDPMNADAPSVPLAPLYALIESPRTIESVGIVEAVARDVDAQSVSVRLSVQSGVVTLRFATAPVELLGWTQTIAAGEVGTVSLFDVVRFTYNCPQPRGAFPRPAGDSKP